MGPGDRKPGAPAVAAAGCFLRLFEGGDRLNVSAETAPASRIRPYPEWSSDPETTRGGPIYLQIWRPELLRPRPRSRPRDIAPGLSCAPYSHPDRSFRRPRADSSYSSGARLQ